MRRIALFLFPLLLLACAKKKEDASVGIDINYTPSFKTGCIEMQASDDSDPTRVVKKTVTGTALANATPPLTLGIVPTQGWGRKLTVTVRAYEQSCEVGSKLVDEAVAPPVDLTGTGPKPKLQVALNTPDEDEDGYVAILGSGKGGTDCNDNKDQRGALMFPGNLEVCDTIDNNCNQQIDEGLDKKWYLDEDGDGVPRGPDFISRCSKPEGNYMEYPDGQQFDCRDTGPDAAKMFPGNPEVCDDIDNDCNNVIDNGFPTLGETCNIECGGVRVCAGDGLSVVCNKEPGRYYHPDRDGDGQGAFGSTSTLKCGTEPADPGTVSNDDDCDDADPAAREGLAEVCDAIDNNCDGVVDNATPVCSGTLKNVASHYVNLGGHDWKTVSVAANGSVWVAGHDGKLALRRPGAQKFESFSHYNSAPQAPTDGSVALNANNCDDHDWNVSWVNANGVVFLAGQAGWIGIHTGEANFDCQPGQVPTSPDNSHITGMIGFEEGGVTTIYLGDVSGRLTRWMPGAPAAEQFIMVNNTDYAYYGLHAFSPDFVLAVGNSGTGNTQKFVSYAIDSQSPATPPTEHVANPNNISGNVRSVWMGSSTGACAVGDNAAVWRWDGGTGWSKVAGPTSVTGRFSGVVMRNDTQTQLTGQCYVVGGDGTSRAKVHRLTQYGWAKPLDIQSATANVALNDLAITQAGEIWIVGEDGRVFHYPEP